MPGPFDFMNVLSGAVYARSKVPCPVDGTAIKAILSSDSGKSPLADVAFTISKEQAERVFETCQKLYNDFKDMFLARPAKGEFFLRFMHMLCKVGRFTKDPDKNIWSSQLIECSLDALQYLNRNTNAYVFAKSILKMHVHVLGETEARSIIRTLAAQKDLYTDITFLLVDSFPELQDLVTEYEPDDRLWKKSAHEIVSRGAQYGGLANDVVYTVRQNKPGSKFGIEIEFVRDGKQGSLPEGLQKNLKNAGVTVLGSVHKDQGVTEIKTPNGGGRV